MGFSLEGVLLAIGDSVGYMLDRVGEELQVIWEPAGRKVEQQGECEKKLPACETQKRESRSLLSRLCSGIDCVLSVVDSELQAMWEATCRTVEKQFETLKLLPDHEAHNGRPDGIDGHDISMPPDTLSRYTANEYLAHDQAYQLDGKKEIRLKNSQGDLIQYRIQKITGVGRGLHGYFLIPKNVDPSQSLDIKIVFRGTQDYASIRRDLESFAAGAETMRNAAPAITQQLSTLIEGYTNRFVNIEGFGHSLGGGDIQNYMTALLKKMAVLPSTISSPLNRITSIHLFTKCSAGVTRDTSQAFNHALALMRKAGRPMDVAVQHMRIKGDVVHSTGETHVGDETSHDQAHVEALTLDPPTGCDNAGRHCHQFFTEGASGKVKRFTLQTNETPAGVRRLHTTLKSSASFLQGRTIKKLQGYCHELLKWLEPSVTRVAKIYLARAAVKPVVGMPTCLLTLFGA